MVARALVATVMSLGLVCWQLFSAQQLLAHSDLHVQIEHLSEQIDEEPGNTELLIKRGDLYRRHGDWAAGDADFEAVRKLQPDHPMVDWFEGHLMVTSGRYSEGDTLLTRFLTHNPNYASAYQVRAVARGNLKQPLLAAADYQAAIDNSERPSPALFRSLILSLVAAGTEHTGAALSATDDGLGRFPTEVTLLGLGADLSLSQANVQATAKYMASVPPGLLNLPQWTFRDALWLCIDGETDAATRLFSDMLSNNNIERARAGTWVLPADQVSQLVNNVSAEACSKAAWSMLLPDGLFHMRRLRQKF